VRARIATTSLLAPLAAFGLLAASPSPSPGAPAHPATIIVTCPSTPLWTFESGADVPTGVPDPGVTLGQRFGYRGTRTTLAGVIYYQTDIPAVEPGLAGTHYWVEQRCASVS